MLRLYASAAYLIQKIHNFIVNDECFICFEYFFIFEKNTVELIRGGVKIIFFCIFGNHLIVHKKLPIFPLKMTMNIIPYAQQEFLNIL